MLTIAFILCDLNIMEGCSQVVCFFVCLYVTRYLHQLWLIDFGGSFSGG